MGCYIDVLKGTKEDWIIKNADPMSEDEVRAWAFAPSNTAVPIVLIDNGAFRAAGVLYSAKERERFLLSLEYERGQGRVRPMSFWVAKIAAVRSVAPYDDYYAREG